MIVDEEPSRPSVMVTTSLKADLAQVAKSRGLEPDRLGRMLRGDLDWIVLKALEKDRTRRYSTASEFAADIDRFLRDEAVEATPPSKVYQLQKFARRHRGLLATLSAVFLTLVMGLFATTLATVRAYSSERKARNAMELARANELSAKRAATLAGASLTLSEADARSLAANWKAEIESSRSVLSANDIDTARSEAQYATWYGSWLSARGYVDEANEILSGVYSSTKKKLGVSDSTFLALCNTRILVSGKTDSDPSTVAHTFDDLIAATMSVHGEDNASQLMPEYAAALVRAGRIDDANEAVQRYLVFRTSQNRPMGSTENAKLDLAIDQIMNSKYDCPELVTLLRSVRETGVVTNANATQTTDDQLARDLNSLQGKWRYKGWKEGKIAEHMIIEFNGDECVTRWLDEESKTIRGRTNRVQLSRNGSAKVFTSYLGGDVNDGAAFIYQLLPHQFVIVSAMLENTPSLPEIELRRFFRMKNGEAD